MEQGPLSISKDLKELREVFDDLWDTVLGILGQYDAGGKERDEKERGRT